MNDIDIRSAYDKARDRFGALGVDTEAALASLASVSLSLPCWQGDDVGGFERSGDELGGGLAVTGRRPGKPRTVDELRVDLDEAFRLVPGRHRVNLHAIYGEFGGRAVDRDAVGPEHFTGWVEWARRRGLKLDFNATCFAHPLAEEATLAHHDAEVRRFWIEHCRRCRRIAAEFGRCQASASIHNLWIPDGTKEAPIDRAARRERLLRALDDVFAERYDPAVLKDSVEGKLFGIGSESFVAGSHEFYLAFAITRGVMICLDTGHFHPTESVADKISALLPFVPELLLHLSRGVRWDSDHVVLATDDVRAIAAEIVRAAALGRVHIALDFFEGGVNRPGALVLGARSVLASMLGALLEPRTAIGAFEREGDWLAALALAEEARKLPTGAVWDEYCVRAAVPPADEWISEIRDYERKVIAARQ
jgi:L-rhamnose isomerase